MSDEQQIWELKHSDILVARLIEYSSDFPWVICHFEPAAAYEEFRSLFEQDLKFAEALESDEDWDEFGALHEKINSLLTLAPVARSLVIDSFLLHIDGNEASFRAIFKDDES